MSSESCELTRERRCPCTSLYLASLHPPPLCPLATEVHLPPVDVHEHAGRRDRDAATALPRPTAALDTDGAVRGSPPAGRRTDRGHLQVPPHPQSSPHPHLPPLPPAPTGSCPRYRRRCRRKSSSWGERR